jgi:hypothetical protein
MKMVDKISVEELKKLSEKMYDPLVKAVVDVQKKLVVIDAEMHVDEEAYLLENGSSQQDVWGVNLYPGKFGSDEFIEFDSMINIRPRQNNHSRTVADQAIRQQIQEIVGGVVHE